MHKSIQGYTEVYKDIPKYTRLTRSCVCVAWRMWHRDHRQDYPHPQR